MRNIILDTNFIIELLKNKIDLNGELSRICNFPFKISVLERTREELEQIVKNQSGKNKELAKLSLIYIKKFNLIKTEEKNVDRALINLSKEDIVATQDKELKEKLNKPFIVIRQKKKLELIA